LSKFLYTQVFFQFAVTIDLSGLSILSTSQFWPNLIFFHKSFFDLTQVSFQQVILNLNSVFISYS